MPLALTGETQPLTKVESTVVALRPECLPMQDTVTARRTSVWLAAILTAALVLRLGVALWLAGQGLHLDDERDYDLLATNVARHGEFAIEPGKLTSIRPPLYPVVVAAIYRVFGDHQYTAVRVFQAAIGTLTVYVVFLLARGMFDVKTALVAAAICAFYPSLVAASGLVLTETLFTLLICACCLAMERYLTTNSLAWLAGCGALLGLGALTRSVLWLFPAPLVLFLLLLGPHWVLKKGTGASPRTLVEAILSMWLGARPLFQRGAKPVWVSRVIAVAVAVAAFGIVLTPWTVRNTRLQKTFTTVDVMGGRNFMMGNYEHTPFDRPWAAIEISGERAWYHVVRQRFPDEAQGLTQGQLDKLAMKYAIQYILKNPGQTAWRDLAKLGHFWQLERETISGLMRGYWGNVPKPAILFLAAAILSSYVLVTLLGIFGCLGAVSANWRMHIFLLLVIAFVCGIHTLVFGHSRYHLPLMPLVGVFAAAAWTSRKVLVARWREPAMLLGAAICLALFVHWGRELVIEAARF